MTRSQSTVQELMNKKTYMVKTSNKITSSKAKQRLKIEPEQPSKFTLEKAGLEAILYIPSLLPPTLMWWGR